MSRLTGDWSKLSRILNNIEKFAEKIKILLEVDTAKKVEIQLKENIKKQLLDLPPLKEEYKKKKSKNNLDVRTLIATGEYVDRLRVFEVKKTKDQIIIVVGASDEDKHHSGLTIGELARIIEYGTPTQPPRPHFRLTWEEIKGKIKKEVVNLVEKEFKKLL
ncbi:MAG: hypothetical protein H0Z24_05895 [Thermosipho sp. (in: Bacteria)]|nr:hypothetical protein [Thermosipho sp. (in: thermotogales)]